LYRRGERKFRGCCSFRLSFWCWLGMSWILIKV
jgi:hypothetical protein